MLHHPAGHAFAHLHAQIAQRRLFAARCNRVVELLLRLVQHQQRPQLRLDERSMCSRMVRRIVSRSKLDVSERASW